MIQSLENITGGNRSHDTKLTSAVDRFFQLGPQFDISRAPRTALRKTKRPEGQNELGIARAPDSPRFTNSVSVPYRKRMGVEDRAVCGSPGRSRWRRPSGSRPRPPPRAPSPAKRPPPPRALRGRVVGCECCVPVWKGQGAAGTCWGRRGAAEARGPWLEPPWATRTCGWQWHGQRARLLRLETEEGEADEPWFSGISPSTACCRWRWWPPDMEQYWANLSPTLNPFTARPK